MRFVPRLTLDEVVLWGTLVFVATSVGYLLLTLIATANQETTAFVMHESYTKRQARYATLETSMGDIRIILHRSQTPTTVNNFVSLAQAGFYDQTKFHRVVRGLLVQGGDPLSREGDTELYGSGGPGYVFDDEIRGLRLERGAVAMANLGRPKTNGSQFFILIGDAPESMQVKYTIFGRVDEGFDVLDRMGEVPVGEHHIPISPITLKSVTLE